MADDAHDGVVVGQSVGLIWLTWPPEKPTAMTPSSWLAERNLDLMVEGDVILKIET